MNTTHFSDLSLAKPILHNLSKAGYETPTDIQSEAIPVVLNGKDLLATAQTGTGKTAAFALPMLHNLRQKVDYTKRHKIRGLIITPTRELAQQINTNILIYGRGMKLFTGVVVGGVSQYPQVKSLRRGIDILVATPGRLMDLMDQGHVDLRDIEMLVLDEADRMLDMGFIHDIRKITAETPKERQTLLFSATMPKSIAELAAQLLIDPTTVAIKPKLTTAENIDQRILFVEQSDKRALLTQIVKSDSVQRALVFTRTKHGANKIAQQLSRKGIAADAIHSDKSQGARQRALAAFDRGRVKVLVATDIVARGIDVDGISHVINFELPEDPESYVHRIGRTARAGAEGTALSFCGSHEVGMLQGIERLTKNTIDADDDHEFHSPEIARERHRRQPKSRKRANSRGRRPQGRGPSHGFRGKPKRRRFPSRAC